jgi:outer membrane immunogenic protein
LPLGAPIDFSTSGFTGGVFGGYNYQMGQWLLGVEADFEYFRSAGSNTVNGLLLGVSPTTVTSSMSTDWLLTLRPRLGIVSGNWLFYGTGGLAVTRQSASWSILAGLVTESASASALEPGWAVGGGVEAALPGNLILGAEYLYANFGSVSTNNGAFFVAGIGFLTNPINQSAHLESNIVRLRLSKLF